MLYPFGEAEDAIRFCRGCRNPASGARLKSFRSSLREMGFMVCILKQVAEYNDKNSDDPQWHIKVGKYGEPVYKAAQTIL